MPNSVIVAFNPSDHSITHAWHTAEINQTPSLPDRSAKPSEINGTSIEDLTVNLPSDQLFRFLRYEIEGEAVLVTSLLGEKTKTLRIAPKGKHSFITSFR